MRTRLAVHDLENFHCRLLLPKSCTACPQRTRFRVMRSTVMRTRFRVARLNLLFTECLESDNMQKTR
ncbi:hypothetical protein GHT06_009904 [Daphnia sinensis]|uniref:Uncharacterized protein n=1 Tax=Daphnia sinensis TaxID=1820382 RepID=A0AAD5PWI5_9CRUS|nr:hypothetical protein GHT06_009904 [Daphnia sinensis]